MILILTSCMGNDTEPIKCIYTIDVELINGSVKTIQKELYCDINLYISGGKGNYDLVHSRLNSNRVIPVIHGCIWFDIISKEMKPNNS